MQLHLGRLVTLLLVSCSTESDQADENKPPTFFQDCVPNDDVCREPFVCLANPELTGTVCTTACETDEQCPAWQATGHCAGPFQSKCRSGVCQYGCK